MLKAIFYKEWIKTGLYFSLAGLVMLGFAGYIGIYLNRIADLAGMNQLWEYMLSSNEPMITLLKYIPLIVGIGGAVAQFAPEMYRKCLKLTLHLPYEQHKLLGSMLLYGCSMLVCFSLISFLILYLSYSNILPKELQTGLLESALPWYLAGICGYLFTAWIVLQPSSKKRILQIIVAAFVLKIFFITDCLGAYMPSLWLLLIITPLTSILSIISLSDFKEGRQD